MLTCTGPRCSGERCREAESIPWCAIHVSFVPSSSVQALVPTGDARVIAGEVVPCCDPRCGAEDNCAAVRPAAAVLAAAAGVAATDEPSAAAGPAGPFVGSEAEFCVSRTSSDAAPPLPETVLALALVLLLGPASGDEAPLTDAAGVLWAAAAACIPASALANACSRSVRALDTGSPAECPVEGALGSAVLESVLGLPPASSAVALPSTGAAASDWASAAEKSLFPAAAGVAPDEAPWAEPA